MLQGHSKLFISLLWSPVSKAGECRVVVNCGAFDIGASGVFPDE